jgi:two-component system LytT family response regulator
VVADCGDGQEALAAITQWRPDILFIDVDLPRLSGFGILARIDSNPRPLTCFMAAPAADAARAFEANALDYLVKPLDAAGLMRTLDTVRAHLRRDRHGIVDPRITALLQSVGAADTAPHVTRLRYLERIAVKTGTKSTYVRTDEVERIEADGNYVRIFTDTRNFLIRSTMARMESALDPARFVRIHRSMIVNLDRVCDIAPQYGHDFIVRLATGARVRMSRLYRGEFDRRMRHGAR